ncbi:hypothetical protein J5J10_22275 [Ciceribacter sp. L1K23]|uniref:hypothetical protein n=1 Tax=Ciceribacter sp. L1K23 TaxID=2820276 RepID=UPI001B839827|nr:hypothetical protein [Ciceribacter sp. L1K23]MBR0558432.1 hypothetical protein [Ciceribacter sp. L1K23]
MRFSLALVALSTLAVPAFAGWNNLAIYNKKIATLQECHDVFNAQTPDWRKRPNFVIRSLPGGREVIAQCLPDGVSELYCDPATNRSAVAVLVDETVPACSGITPKLRVRNVDVLALE